MKCTIKCPHCGQQYEDIEYVPGQKVECESCQQSFVICMSVVVDTPAKSSLINSKQSELYASRQNSIASPVESWLESKNDNKREAGKNNGIGMDDWQKNLKNYQTYNDLSSIKSINLAINIWTWLCWISIILFLFSLPLSVIRIYILMDQWIPEYYLPRITIILSCEFSLLFACFFSFCVKVVLESFRTLNNNVKVIATVITNLKESSNSKT